MLYLKIFSGQIPKIQIEMQYKYRYRYKKNGFNFHWDFNKKKFCHKKNLTNAQIMWKLYTLALSSCSTASDMWCLPCCTFLSFSGEPSPGSSIRYVETQSMQIGASYSLQFSLVMGCGREPSPHIDTQVRLEFSTNHGLTWHLVKEVRSVKRSHLCSPRLRDC